MWVGREEKLAMERVGRSVMLSCDVPRFFILGNHTFIFGHGREGCGLLRSEQGTKFS